ncbi:hypothetical protein CYMTET_28333 [Cymbomonas tetramitiformis]|uniref:Uncharacterized protein n=1 Tax=Cymbomonas tetramitiformis TaxID=36881 RepID=A0AAE0KWC0_9CHLO|nr:hypothetical protein CYMTET_28333 [Cymbomonas tetramitiformis]
MNLCWKKDPSYAPMAIATGYLPGLKRPRMPTIARQTMAPPLVEAGLVVEEVMGEEAMVVAEMGVEVMEEVVEGGQLVVGGMVVGGLAVVVGLGVEAGLGAEKVVGEDSVGDKEVGVEKVVEGWGWRREEDLGGGRRWRGVGDLEVVATVMAVEEGMVVGLEVAVEEGGCHCCKHCIVQRFATMFDRN